MMSSTDPEITWIFGHENYQNVRYSEVGNMDGRNTCQPGYGELVQKVEMTRGILI